jgi:hypothetical protein
VQIPEQKNEEKKVSIVLHFVILEKKSTRNIIHNLLGKEGIKENGRRGELNYDIL